MSHPLAQYHYEISDENIRKEPLALRDHAKLLVYNTTTDTITVDVFYNIAQHLPKDALMVLNNTGVIPARIFFQKDTGGKGEGLILVNEGFQSDGTIPMIVNRGLQVGRHITIAEKYRFTVVRQDEQKFFMKPEFDPALIPLMLQEYGTTPTPPYLGEMALSEDALRTRYQTVFAKQQKSVAAPTASLHFTDRVFKSFHEKGIHQVEVTLDVGLGTFQDVKQDNIERRFLHSEPFHIPGATFQELQHAKRSGTPIIAVGTTAVRTLEANASVLMSEEPHDIVGTTNIFILPPYQFQVVNCMITNFHVPQSSLMALVDAFLQHKGARRSIVDLYTVAIKEGFQFFSFGDSMLIL